MVVSNDLSGLPTFESLWSPSGFRQFAVETLLLIALFLKQWQSILKFHQTE